MVDAGLDADLREGAGVDEQVDPLARGELARRVLAVDLLLPAAEPQRGAALAQVVGERAQHRGGRGVGAHGVVVGAAIGHGWRSLAPPAPK